jgi:hypothetical protein
VQGMTVEGVACTESVGIATADDIQLVQRALNNNYCP